MKKYIINMQNLILVLFIVLDQISKVLARSITDSIEIIPGILNFTLVKNYGGVFGIGQGSNYILAGITTIICACIIGYICYLKKKDEKVSFFLYMILAGRDWQFNR